MELSDGRTVNTVNAAFLVAEPSPVSKIADLVSGAESVIVPSSFQMRLATKAGFCRCLVVHNLRASSCGGFERWRVHVG